MHSVEQKLCHTTIIHLLGHSHLHFSFSDKKKNLDMKGMELGKEKTPHKSTHANTPIKHRKALALGQSCGSETSLLT